MLRRSNAALQASRSWPRVVFTFVALFAFVLQGCVTQTHIHFPSDAGRFIAPGLASPGNAHAKLSPDKRQHPDNDDPANCPICQQILFSGEYLSPAPAVLRLPSLVAYFALLVPADLVVVQRQSHIWLSRGPPLL